MEEKDIRFERDKKMNDLETWPWYYFDEGRENQLSDAEINDFISRVLEDTKKNGHSRISSGDISVHGHKWGDSTIDLVVATSKGFYELTVTL